MADAPTASGSRARSRSPRGEPRGPATSVDPETLKELGHATLEMLCKHLGQLHSKSALANVKPGELAAQFAGEAPPNARPFHDILRDIEEKMIPGMTHWQHPRFMAYFPASTSVPAVLAELVIASLGSVGLMWTASPIQTELEVVVMDWIAKFLGIGGDFLHTSGRGGGLIQGTAGEALVNVFVCARVHKQRLLHPELSRDELFYADSSKLVVYQSDQAHFSGPKACRLAGIRVHIVKCKMVDGNLRLQASDVEAAIAEDKAKGLVPCAVQLNYGTTNTSGCDDASDFAELVERESIWLHFDAAYAGPAWSLDEFRADADKMAKVATSFNLNGSKWFLAGFDTGFLYVRDRKLLIDVFSATGDYLAPTVETGIFNPEFKDWAVPLGRRFRSLRVWLVLQYFGTAGLQGYLQKVIDQANWLRKRIDEHPAFKQVVKTRFGLVCLKFNKGEPSDEVSDKFTEDLAVKLREDGFLLYTSKLEGRTMLRIALGGANSELSDIQALWDAMCAFAGSK